MVHIAGCRGRQPLQFTLEKFCAEKWMQNGESERRRRLPEDILRVQRAVRLMDSASITLEKSLCRKMDAEWKS